MVITQALIQALHIQRHSLASPTAAAARMMVSAIADETLELLQLTLRRATEHQLLGRSSQGLGRGRGVDGAPRLGGWL